MKKRYSVFQRRREKRRKRQFRRWLDRVDARRLKSSYFPRDGVRAAKNNYFLSTLYGTGLAGKEFREEEMTRAMESATARDEVLNFGYGDHLKWAIDKGCIGKRYVLIPDKNLGESHVSALSKMLCVLDEEEINSLDRKNLNDLGFKVNVNYFLTTQGKVLCRQSWFNNSVAEYIDNKKITIDDRLDNQRRQSLESVEKVLVGAGASETKYS